MSRRLLFSRQLLTWRQIRFFSSSLSPPYLIMGSCPRGNLNVLNLSELRPLEKKVALELFEDSAIIGASNGWVATLKNRVLRLQDDLNPHASEKKPKRISLPRLVTLPHCQTQLVTNVAMSSSSPEDEDCIVAVKFLGPQLSLCRPAHGSDWTNIRITDPSFYTSQVMFSKRDQMFSLLGSGGYRIGSWDLDKHKKEPKWLKLQFQNLPRSTQTTKAAKELFNSMYRTEHLVESKAGETFLVRWYKHSTLDEDITDVKTRGVVVFKVDEKGNAVFTKDIGDLCIFISKSEPFCVSPSSYPGCSYSGLEPNNVNVVDENELGAINLFNFTHTTDVSHVCYETAYFIPPQKLD